MYLLELDSTHREYLLFLLAKEGAPTAVNLAAQLKGSEDVFGVVMWTDRDIGEELQQQDVPKTRENILAVRDSYHVRHIGDQMVDHGWSVLREAVAEFKRSGANPG